MSVKKPTTEDILRRALHLAIMYVINHRRSDLIKDEVNVCSFFATEDWFLDKAREELWNEYEADLRDWRKDDEE